MASQFGSAWREADEDCLDCVVCFEPMDIDARRPMVLPCKGAHQLCFSCAGSLRSDGVAQFPCPMCREEVNATKYLSNRGLICAITFEQREQEQDVQVCLSESDIVARVRSASGHPPDGGLLQPRGYSSRFVSTRGDALSRESIARLATEALRQAESEGLVLVPAPKTWRGESLFGSGYKGVKCMYTDGMMRCYLPFQSRVDGCTTLGCFETAEQAALARARYCKRTGHLDGSFTCTRCGGRKIKTEACREPCPAEAYPGELQNSRRCKRRKQSLREDSDHEEPDHEGAHDAIMAAGTWISTFNGMRDRHQRRASGALGRWRPELAVEMCVDRLVRQVEREAATDARHQSTVKACLDSVVRRVEADAAKEQRVEAEAAAKEEAHIRACLERVIAKVEKGAQRKTTAGRKGTKATADSQASAADHAPLLPLAALVWPIFGFAHSLPVAHAIPIEAADCTRPTAGRVLAPAATAATEGGHRYHHRAVPCPVPTAGAALAELIFDCRHDSEERGASPPPVDDVEDSEAEEQEEAGLSGGERPASATVAESAHDYCRHEVTEVGGRLL